MSGLVSPSCLLAFSAIRFPTPSLAPLLTRALRSHRPVMQRLDQKPFSDTGQAIHLRLTSLACRVRGTRTLVGETCLKAGVARCSRIKTVQMISITNV